MVWSCDAPCAERTKPSYLNFKDSSTPVVLVARISLAGTPADASGTTLVMLPKPGCANVDLDPPRLGWGRMIEIVARISPT
jgi:hypothetical protein